MPTRLSGLLANRPNANKAVDAFYFATDTNRVYVSDGKSWAVRPALDDADIVDEDSGTLAQRPASSSCVGWVYHATDTAASYEAFPTAWFQYRTAGLSVIYTGKPQMPITLSMDNEALVIEELPGPSTQILSPSKMRGIGAFYYNEGPGTTGAVPMGGRNLLTLEFPNLEYVRESFSPTNLPLITSIRLPELKIVAGQFAPAGCVLLTELYVPKLERVGNGNSLFGSSFAPTGSNNSLAIVNAPALKSVAGQFSAANAALTQVLAPLLEYCNSINVGGNPTGLTALTFPALKMVAGNFNCSFLPELLTFTCPELEYVGGNVGTNTAAKLTNFSFPKLKVVGGNFAPATMALLNTVQLPLLVQAVNITLNSSLGNLANVVLGTIGTLKKITGSVNVSGQKLTQASVDGILALIASLDGTNGTTSFGTGQSVALNGGTNSAPSAAGLANKAIIVARGATVTNNS